MSGADRAHMRDPAYVREQYASEEGLAARSSLYGETTGPFAGDVAFDAVAEASPGRMLEVGCGNGWFSARVQRELGVAVVAIDQSERMVELARVEGVDARVANVQALPFADGEFDLVAANWMLYHVADLDRGLAEISRVLTPGGRLVAITNGKDHLLELWRLVGAEETRLWRDVSFGAENGAEILARHFRDVELWDSSGTVVITGREAVVRYVESSKTWKHLADRVPARVDRFIARRSNVVFVATA
ncbi:MAG: class I SAM-dependent methyltransferase [Actinomycetota bacterium]|nr:class I SAM-dependent methyltransferase [Actinomycetota bacterium]